MKTFKQYITEATASRDQAFIDEAEFVFQKLIEDNYRYKLKNYFSDTDKFTKETKKFVVCVGTVTKNHIYDDLYVVFSPETEKSRGLYVKVSPTARTIALNVLNDEDRLQKNPVFSALSRDYSNIRLTFIHEFIHYLDSTRIGNERWDSIVKSKTNMYLAKSNTQIYFNQPLEFNAYYQQGIAKLEGFIKYLFVRFGEGPEKVRQEIEKEKERLFADNFNDFLKFSLEQNIFPKAYYDSLTEKNKKKLMSRYYGMYKDIVKPKLEKLELMMDNYERQRRELKKNTRDS